MSTFLRWLSIAITCYDAMSFYFCQATSSFDQIKRKHAKTRKLSQKHFFLKMQTFKTVKTLKKIFSLLISKFPFSLTHRINYSKFSVNRTKVQFCTCTQSSTMTAVRCCLELKQARRPSRNQVIQYSVRIISTRSTCKTFTNYEAIKLV